MLSISQRAAALDELEKVILMSSEGIPVAMFSGAIDEIWHELLFDPTQYEALCLRICGSVVGHREGYGAGTVQFIECYERRWGVLPEIWFTSSIGVLDEKNLKEYEKYGTVQASWNCQATHNCMIVYEPDKRPNRSIPNSPSTGTPDPNSPPSAPVQPNQPPHPSQP
jgi:hypothetical protein